MNPSDVTNTVLRIGLLCLAAVASFERAHAEHKSLDFATVIAPIVEQHCVGCHAPGNEQGDISLATIRDLRANEYVVAGDPDASYLVELISAGEGDRPEMPKEKDPLSADQVALIRQWIAEGAKWPEEVVVRQQSSADASWWSLQPLAVAEPRVTGDTPEHWRENPIDRFVFAKLSEHDLRPNPPADRPTLIRRASYDSIGLPPTPEQIEAFVQNGDPKAYQKMVDRLLQSPHYGERWGRHWLDVVRFGESNGYERNFIINQLWPFRDYVIQSFNDNKPFNQFIREHLAGDVFGKDHPSVEVGTAFLVAGPFDDVGNQDPVQAAQIRANTIDEIIRSTGEAFLGLTIGCARCHDHKFDPVRQQDYYAFYATFAGVRHGNRVVARPEERMAHAARLAPLHDRRDTLTKQRDALVQAVVTRARKRADKYQKTWIRNSTNRQGTEENIPAVVAKFVRLVSKGQDVNPNNTKNFTIDEFEVWSAEEQPRNVALASAGAKASGASRRIEDFPDAYGPQLAIDGKVGEQFIATGGTLTVELAKPVRIDRIFFSSARDETTPEHPQFLFVAEYRIEVSLDGEAWTEVANSDDRRPVHSAHRDKRLRELEITEDEKAKLAELTRQLASVGRKIAAVDPLPTIWIGTRDAAGVKGPFHVFLGGSPQRKGDGVVPTSLTALSEVVPRYELEAGAPEGNRRQALAEWIVHPKNPLTPRVLANRVWHYHFGTGIVDTPSDFGYMGGRPTHPELLDWLASRIQHHDWRLKPLHKLIMMSQTYRQSSGYRPEAAKVDSDSRLLWRFSPRRLSAEEIRDTVLMVTGKLDTRMGGPGFRLYRFLQDNVATYLPLDTHGPETYRRAVYHQNARASVVDLMTEFDQPDCAFSTPKRAETTTPLQALTMLNHRFTLDMAEGLAERLIREVGTDPSAQVRRAYARCYGRLPARDETAACVLLIEQHSLATWCRVLLNTSEMIYVQ